MKKIWVSWERHRRTAELAAALDDVHLYVIQLEAPRAIRYTWLLLKTAWFLARKLPDIVIVQNPSIVLALFMTTMGRLLVRTVVVDAHNEGIKPFYAKYNRFLSIYRLIQRRSDLTIVTNTNLADEVSRNGGNPFVLEDSVPSFSAPHKISLQGRHNIAFVCTFEKDEPYQEVVASARLIDPTICVYVTGRFQKAARELVDGAPANVKFTGFLSEKDYVDLLYSCDAVMDLTLLEDCLVCGAYEAVALEKPMILSDTKALRSYFSFGAVYTENNSEAVAAAIKQVIVDKDRLDRDVKALRAKLNRDWRDKLNTLEAVLRKRFLLRRCRNRCQT